jgi:hypothetical protein
MNLRLYNPDRAVKLRRRCRCATRVRNRDPAGNGDPKFPEDGLRLIFVDIHLKITFSALSEALSGPTRAACAAGAGPIEPAVKLASKTVKKIYAIQPGIGFLPLAAIIIGRARG